MRISCPECEHELVITVKSTMPTSSDPASPLSARALRAVLEFMKTREPGRHPAGGLYQAFQNWDGLDPAVRGLTQNAFGRALKRNGAAPYRTSTERGYGIPVIPDDAVPGKVSRWASEAAQKSPKGAPVLMGQGEIRVLSPSGKPYTTHYLDADDNRIPVDKPQWVLDEEIRTPLQAETVPTPVPVDEYFDDRPKGRWVRDVGWVPDAE